MENYYETLVMYSLLQAYPNLYETDKDHKVFNCIKQIWFVNQYVNTLISLKLRRLCTKNKIYVTDIKELKKNIKLPIYNFVGRNYLLFLYQRENSKSNREIKSLDSMIAIANDHFIKVRSLHYEINTLGTKLIMSEEKINKIKEKYETILHSFEFLIPEMITGGKNYNDYFTSNYIYGTNLDPPM